MRLHLLDLLDAVLQGDTMVCSSHSRASQEPASAFWVSLTARKTTSTGPPTRRDRCHRARDHDRVALVGPQFDSIAGAPAHQDG